MRADGGRSPRTARLVVTALLVAVAVAPRNGSAQSLRGVAEVQYSNLSRAAVAQDLESWQTLVQLDYATRLRRDWRLSSQVRWSELTYTDRPDRVRTPQGTLRLAHPFYGLAASYRPVTVTDANDVTTKQQELRFTGNFARPGLPRIAGSWARRHVDPALGVPGGSSIRRDLTASYNHGAFDFRANWGDQSRRSDSPAVRSTAADRLGFGSTGNFRGARWSAGGRYDFSQSRTKDNGEVVRISRLHAADANGALRISRRTTGTLNYSVQHTNLVRPSSASFTEHNGSANVGHELSRVFRASLGGGVRTASIAGRRETESYALASLTASAQVRPGWTAGSGLTHSYNWLPRERPRPITSFQASTIMRLARRLEVNGGLGGSYSKQPVASADTLTAGRQVAVQAGAGIRAPPPPPITITASASRSRTAATFGLDGEASTAYTSRVDWKPHASLQLTGEWSRIGGLRRSEPHRTTLRGSAEWNPSQYLQAAANYSRFSLPTRDPLTSLSSDRQAFSGRLVVGLTRDLRATIQYSEADPDLPTQSEQVTVTVTQSFRR